jgi:hypothetical protein
MNSCMAEWCREKYVKIPSNVAYKLRKRKLALFCTQSNKFLRTLHQATNSAKFPEKFTLNNTNWHKSVQLDCGCKLVLLHILYPNRVC